MILEKLDLVSHIIEVVNGDDILDTYKRSTAGSCMSGADKTNQARLRFYTFVEGLALMRIRTVPDKSKGSIIMRSLIWTGTDKDGNTVRVADRVYGSSEMAHKLHTEYWQKFADVSRSTAKQIICNFTVDDAWLSLWTVGRVYLPFLDTFQYHDRHVKTGRISNKILSPLPAKKAKKAKV